MRTLFQSCLLGVWLLALPAVAQSQLTFTTNSGAITITGFTGNPTVLNIPGVTNGYPVTGIGTKAFYQCYSLVSVTIPDSVINIGSEAFDDCTSLAGVTIPNSVTRLGNAAFIGCSSLAGAAIPDSLTSLGNQLFWECQSLTNITLPNSITNIGSGTFEGCTSLASVTIPGSVISLGSDAFWDCTSLTSVTIPGSIVSLGSDAFAYCYNLTSLYFTGNAPGADSTVFTGDSVTNYYLPGTTGWGAALGMQPTTPWFLPNPLILSNGPGFGVQSNQFGFTISWATNASIVVQVCTNLAGAVFTPVATNALANGTFYFSDPQWKNYSSRFYRLSTP